MSSKGAVAATMTVKEGSLPDRLPSEPLKLTQEQQKEKDQEMVTAIFRWYENPGGTMACCYQRYKGEPLLMGENCTFTDGHKYTVPYGLVRHINEDCAYPEHSYLMDANGVPIPSKRKGYQRMEFIPSW